MIHVDPEIRADAMRRAEEDFARHEVTVVLDTDVCSIYRCKRPGSGVYWFDIIVTSTPARLWLTGDIGDLILAQTPGTDMLSWAGRSVDSPSYIFSKVPSEIRKGITEWDMSLGEMDIKDLRQEASEEEDDERKYRLYTWAEDLEDFLTYETTPDEWVREYTDTTGGWEGVTTERYTWMAFFRLEAIRWLYNHQKET